jgi:hypothetical protein
MNLRQNHGMIMIATSGKIIWIKMSLLLNTDAMTISKRSDRSINFHLLETLANDNIRNNDVSRE